MDALDGLTEFEKILQQSVPKTRDKLKLAMRDIATMWQMQAKLRAPVDTGILRNQVLNEHGIDTRGEFFAAVGSNQKYAKFVEFGTKYIAGGQVQALGTRPDITDTEAIKSWPAKDKGGGQREQMPWLRPAWMHIKDKAMKKIDESIVF